MRIFLTALLAACALLSTAAELRLRGEVTDHVTRMPLGEVLVRVYRNGVKEQVFHTGPAGKYNITLERGGEYIIRFSLPDHVTKCYAVDTRGAAWEDDTREVSVDVEMTPSRKCPVWTFVLRYAHGHGTLLPDDRPVEVGCRLARSASAPKWKG